MRSSVYIILYLSAVLSYLHSEPVGIGKVADAGYDIPFGVAIENLHESNFYRVRLTIDEKANYIFSIPPGKTIFIQQLETGPMGIDLTFRPSKLATTKIKNLGFIRLFCRPNGLVQGKTYLADEEEIKARSLRNTVNSVEVVSVDTFCISKRYKQIFVEAY